MIALIKGGGLVIILFVLAWGATEMMAGVAESTGGPPPDRAAFKQAIELGALPWILGAGIVRRDVPQGAG
ncbi:MAG TPA: hypothetical protein VK988_22395 [Acidimicrobiales bacterium]|nr:hypothetical protein [Acidimicrobiales bacterium]